MPCAPVSSVRRGAAPAPYGFHDTTFSRCAPEALHLCKGACAATMRPRLLLSGAGTLQNMPKGRCPRRDMRILHFFCRRAALRHLKKRVPRTWGIVSPPLPAKPGACISPGRAACRQASQEALNTLSPASLAPPSPVNGVLPAACCIFCIEYCPASLETGSESLLLFPAQARVVVSLTAARPRLPVQPGPCGKRRLGAPASFSSLCF